MSYYADFSEFKAALAAYYMQYRDLYGESPKIIVLGKAEFVLILTATVDDIGSEGHKVLMKHGPDCWAQVEGLYGKEVKWSDKDTEITLLPGTK